MWEKLFGQKVNWKSSYTIPYKITVVTNLRCFQYKLLTRTSFQQTALQTKD